jgi:hypothetical protein
VSSSYQAITPDFYLISSEGYGINQPISCWKRKRLYGAHPDGYMLCDINPPLVGQHYGMGAGNVKQIVLASRHQGYSLFPIKEWPAYVHIALPNFNVFKDQAQVKESDIKLIAWGELCHSKIDIPI